MAGKITELLAQEDDTVAVGQDLLRIEPGEGGGSSSPSTSSSSESSEKREPAKKEDPPAQDNVNSDDSLKSKGEEKVKQDSKEEKKAAPPAKEEKKEEKPAPKETSGSASRKEKDAVEKKAAGSRNETRVGVPGYLHENDQRRLLENCRLSAEPSGTDSGASIQVKMSRMRLTIAKRLKEAQNTAASLTTFNEIDMSALMAFRSRHKDAILKSEGVKLGFMSAFAKASCLALKEIPAANASIEGDSIVYRDYVDLSVAVSTEKGLVTPVVRNCEGMNLVEIEQAIAGLGKKVGHPCKTAPHF